MARETCVRAMGCDEFRQVSLPSSPVTRVLSADTHLAATASSKQNEGPRRSVSLCFRHQFVPSGAAPSVWAPTRAPGWSTAAGHAARRGTAVEHAAQAGAGSPYATACRRMRRLLLILWSRCRMRLGLGPRLVFRMRCRSCAMAALDATGTQGAMPEPDETAGLLVLCR